MSKEALRIGLGHFRGLLFAYPPKKGNGGIILFHSVGVPRKMGVAEIGGTCLCPYYKGILLFGVYFRGPLSFEKNGRGVESS